MILLIPLIYILPHFFADKTFAVFLAEPVADTLAVTTTVTLFFTQFRKLMTVSYTHLYNSKEPGIIARLFAVSSPRRGGNRLEIKVPQTVPLEAAAALPQHPAGLIHIQRHQCPCLLYSSHPGQGGGQRRLPGSDRGGH